MFVGVGGGLICICIFYEFLEGLVDFGGDTIQPFRWVGPFLFSVPSQSVMVLCVGKRLSESESFFSGLGSA